MDSLARLFFYLSIIFLSFLVGSLITEFRVFPYAHVKQVYDGGRALARKLLAYDTPLTTNYWRQARRPEMGVIQHDPAAAYEGLTLYTSAHAQKAFLVDMAGDVVHEWTLDFHEIWPEPPHVAWPVDGEFIYVRKAVLFPNGDLLAILVGQGDTPWGYGLVKIDKDSNLIWSYPANVHHDVDVAPDGTIYALTHRVLSEPIPGINYQPPFMDDEIDVLTPDGELIKRVSVHEAVRDSASRYSILDPFITWPRGDILHINAIDYVDERLAALHPYLSAGQVVLSSKNLGLLFAVDLDTKTVPWILRGPWQHQHDGDLLDNGNILLFDNMGHFGPKGRSRILEIDPITHEIEWAYVGTEENPFESQIRSAQQRLANGNTLITESSGGRIFEVTPEQQIVWEYINPVRAGENNSMIPIVSWAQRFTRDELPFLSSDGS